MRSIAAASGYAKKLSYRLMGYGVNGKDLNVYPDDVFLVGYPKSGNTWLDFLVACLRADRSEDINFGSVETYVADIYYNNARVLHGLGRPRFLKSHEPFDHRYPKVVYIVRDPRAVAISYYHFLIARYRFGVDYPLGRFIPEFIQGKWGGFGTWDEHVRGWLNEHEQDKDRVMIVKYEDMKADVEQTLIKMDLFLQLEASNEKIQSAISWTSPENMRRLEATARGLSHPGFDKFREGSFFVRKAGAASWNHELSESLGSQIETAWGGIMHELGYI